MQGGIYLILGCLVCLPEGRSLLAKRRAAHPAILVIPGLSFEREVGTPLLPFFQ